MGKNIVEDERGVVAFLINMGKIYLMMERVDEAKNCFREGLKIAGRFGDDKGRKVLEGLIR